MAIGELTLSNPYVTGGIVAVIVVVGVVLFWLYKEGKLKF